MQPLRSTTIARQGMLVLLLLVGTPGAAAAAPTAVPTADLSLTKTDSADPVTVGSNFTYTLTVSNAGPDRATDVVITDTLPSGVTFVSGTGGCSAVGQTVTCTRANLNSGASASFTLTVTATTAGEWTNTATVAADQADPVSGNNTATQTTRIRTGAPGGLTCFADPAGVHLDWNDVAQATSYNVYRRTGTSGAFVLLASTTASSHTDATAAVGQSYQYQVTAVSAGGESVASETCTIASVPAFPTLLAGALAAVGAVGAFVALRRRA